MRKNKLLTIMLCLTLLIAGIGTVKVLNPAIADDTVAGSVYETVYEAVYDTVTDILDFPDDESSSGTAEGTDTTTDPTTQEPNATDNQEANGDTVDETQGTVEQEPVEQPIQQQLETDTSVAMDDEADLPLFIEAPVPESDAPMMRIETFVVKTQDGQEIELSNNDLTLEEKAQCLRQGFSIQDIYSASQVGYMYGMDTKSVLKKVRVMAAKQKDSGQTGTGIINWKAVGQQLRRDDIKKNLDRVKNKYPEEIAEMDANGIPGETQIQMLIIRNCDKNVKISELVKEYKGKGKQAIKNQMKQKMNEHNKQNNGPSAGKQNDQE